MSVVPRAFLEGDFSRHLKLLVNMIKRQANCSSYGEFAAFLGSESAPDEKTRWVCIVEAVETDSDLFSLIRYLMEDANVYKVGDPLWKAMTSVHAKDAYKELWERAGDGTNLNPGVVLEFLAAICHVLYSSSEVVNVMVTIIKEVTGDPQVFMGDTENGWASEGAKIVDGKIVL